MFDFMTRRLSNELFKSEVNYRLNVFIDNNTKESVFIDRIMSFGRSNWVFVSSNIDEYRNGQWNKSTMIIAIVCKVMILITAIRFLLSFIVDKKWMTIAMSDAHYVFGYQRIASCVVWTSALLSLLIGLILLITEINQESGLFNFLIQAKDQKLPKLCKLHSQKWFMTMNLLTKYLLQQAYLPMTLILFLTQAILALLAYLDPNSHFNLALTSFWFIVLIPYMFQIYIQ